VSDERTRTERTIPPPSAPPPRVLTQSSTAPGNHVAPALSPAGEPPSSPAPPDDQFPADEPRPTQSEVAE